jgi:hypothetical protein
MIRLANNNYNIIYDLWHNTRKMQKLGVAMKNVRKWWHTMPPRSRSVSVKLLLIWMSFCVGLVVFHVPGRQFASIPEVWLPHVQKETRSIMLDQPVKARNDQQHGVRFMPAHPGSPEIIEVDATKTGQAAADCPDFYDVKELLPSKCKTSGVVGGQKVYTITRVLPSMNVNAYMMRGDTLIALSGMYSEQDAVEFFRTFKKVARRDVPSLLSRNRIKAETVTAAIKDEKRAAAKAKTEAYKHLDFKPALPAILPAGWVQHSVRILGDDAARPTGVEVLYKKGTDHFITYTMKARQGFELGEKCGPTPGAGDAMLLCGPVPKEDYYAGGTSGTDYASWYTYRQVGDLVAVLGTSVYGERLLFTTEDLEAQVLIAKSLRPAGTERLKGAEFVGATHDPYPFIQP